MEWITVVTLIAIGVALLIVEIIFIPGTTVVGFIGFGLIISGVVVSFRSFGSDAGWLTLGTSSVLCGGILYFAFTTKAWNKFASKDSINSRVNQGELEKFGTGMEGTSLSVLRPIGKAEFDGNIVEVRSNGDYVNANVKIKIVRIEANQIYIETIN
jgi:membrane-bound ClpP family serine protease